MGAILIALHFIPWAVPSATHLVIMLFLFAVMGQGWNVLGGYAGQASFGHAIFFGTGAYISTMLYLKLGLSPWIGMLFSVLGGIVLGIFIGFLSFRYGLKGPFFALIMLAFAEIFHMIALGWSAIGGSEGLLIPLEGNAPLKMQFIDKDVFFFLSLWMVVGSLYLVWRLERTKLGLYFLACREDHDAAESLGVNTFKAQMMAMVISAGLTSVAGTVYAQYLLYIDPDSVFGLLNSVEIMLRPIIGGAGTIFGPLLGSLVFDTASRIFQAGPAILQWRLFDVVWNDSSHCYYLSSKWPDGASTKLEETNSSRRQLKHGKRFNTQFDGDYKIVQWFEGHFQCFDRFVFRGNRGADRPKRCGENDPVQCHFGLFEAGGGRYQFSW